eukprot:s2167_g17.t1
MSFSVEGPEPNPLTASMTFTTWAICLPRWILQSRTDFSWHLRRSFHFSLLQPSQLSTTVLPLPLPSSSSWCWGSFPKISRRRLSKLARARLLHVVVFSLNYMYLGRYPTCSELGRRPSAAQSAILARLRSHLAVCWSSDEPFPLAPGRSGPELGASLCQLEKFIDGCSVFRSSYLDGPVGFQQDPTLFPSDDFPQLVPYRSLDAARLRLVGEGAWPMEKFIREPLWLPFQEPAFLRHGLAIDEACAPNFQRESRDECLKLMKVWDAKGLLRLFKEPAEPGLYCRVFNAFKSRDQDRQIGDRRRVNMTERSYDGPSKFLPPDPILTQLHLRRFREKFVASVTDRRDFYHQASVTDARANTNLLPFQFEPFELEGLSAFESFRTQTKGSRSGAREVVGDRLGLGLTGGGGRSKQWKPCPLFGGFGSLFQGDHLGVEFALCSHQTLLEEVGLLHDSHQVRGHCPFPKGPLFSGLVIDDFFLIGREDMHAPAHETAAAKALETARTAYKAEGLLGSDEKDVVSAEIFKAAGAEIVSDQRAVRSGYVTIGAPRGKRLALAALSLRVARLPGITPPLASKLSGNWSSVLLYRRCLNSVVDDLYAVGAGAEADDGLVMPLSRKVARELVLLSVVAPLASSNAAVDYLDCLFSSDASLSKGAVVSADLDPRTIEDLWLDSDKKGSYALLDNGFREALKHLGVFDGEEVMPDPPIVRPKASPLLYFDFVEICRGVGAVTSAAADLGLVCAPPLDLSASEHYNLCDLRLLDWAIYMIESGRFGSFLCEPPCTTFSPAAYPNLRSYLLPYGYDRSHPRVIHGNCLAFRSLVLLWVGRRHSRPCGLEQPRRSKMGWLREWLSLVESGDFEEAIVAACRFNSPHQKEFKFLLHAIPATWLEARCTRDHQHIRIQGQVTKQSAIYTPELGIHLALAFKRALRVVAFREAEGPDCAGLESVVMNDLMCTLDWNVEKAWTWKRPAHINVLEVSAGLGVLARVGNSRPHCRFVSALDSAVARGALSKGRSTSRLLQPLLRRSAVLQLCFDVYPVWPFCPTRHNTADDPTRDVEVRQSLDLSVRACQGVDFRLLHRTGLRRFAANWVRLFLLVVSCRVSEAVPYGLHDHDADYAEPWTFRLLFDLWTLLFESWGRLCLSAWWTFVVACLPGLLVCCVWLLGYGLLGAFALACLRARSPTRLLRPIGFCLLFASPALSLDFVIGAHAMEPTSAAERKRATLRRAVDLAGDRVILETTRKRRRELLQKFQAWLWCEKGVSLTFLLRERPPDPEKICSWLVLYGRELYKAGKAYGIFAETINAVSAARPILRKQLTLAWDLAFSWIAGEPYGHHAAMPASVLLGLLSIALLWGWLTEAAVLGMTWAGILRIGEALQACRKDLVLPKDAAPGTHYALLKISEPKTRGRHAKHQAARIDPCDIVLLLELAFSKKDAGEKLWPYSAATLRKRLGDLMCALKLPTSGDDKDKQFDLSSLRPGGASWLLNTCEDSELVRRRGRWATTRTMEIYLQEVLYVTYVEQLPRETKDTIEVCAAGFPDLLQHARYFVEAAASSAALQTPLLAEQLPLGLSLAKPKRTSQALRWLLQGERAATANESCPDAAPALVGLCALLVSETALVHYTPRPKGITASPVQPSGTQAIDEKYWKRRYNYFARFDEGVRMDLGAWFEVTPESVARHIADRLQYDRVVDGTCGVGGNAIQFAMTSRAVVAVDTDSQRLEDARHNAGIYGVADRISFVHDDFVHFAETYKGPTIDAVFLSPPWGGPGHLDCPHFSLRDVEVPDIVLLFAAATKLSSRVALYLPRHTDLHEVAILASHYGYPAVEVEKVFFQHPTPHLKLVVVYFSPDALEQGIPKKITQKTVGPKIRPHQSQPQVASGPIPDLLSSNMSGVLLRAVYCRSYLGRFVVRLAMQMQELEAGEKREGGANSAEGRNFSNKGRGRTAQRGQPRQARLKPSSDSQKASPSSCGQGEVQKATAQSLCQAFGGAAAGSELDSAQQLLAEAVRACLQFFFIFVHTARWVRVGVNDDS